MGDTTKKILPCPKCGKDSDQYDCPTSMLWVWTCDYCGWKDDRNYHVDEDGRLLVISDNEANKIGIKKNN